MSKLSRVLVILSTLALLHVTYSTYEYLSILKALDKPEDSIPNDIVIEALSALVVFLFATVINAPKFVEITWASEMSKRSIDEMNSRMGFASYNHPGNHVLSQ